MSPTINTILRASRPAFRSSTFFTSQAAATSSRQAAFAFRAARVRNTFSKRWQSTAGGPTTAEAVQQSWFQRMWNSPIGLKTVHFWAPIMKWCLVLAGIADFARPAETLSLTQNFALTCTGAIWTRWCLIIKPKNILLATVNFFLGCVGVVQVSRILMWRSSEEGKASLAAEAIKNEEKSSLKGVKDEVKGAVAA